MSNPMLWAGSPNSYTPGRPRPVQYVALHYTAGSEGPSSAENGVTYDKTRTDGTSCHAFFDSQGPGLQEVGFGDRSHSAYFYGNEIGVHFEICGTIQTRAQWLDPISMATLRTCAAAVAYTCDTLGLARRRLTVDEVRAAYNAPAGQRPTGICDHAAITAAYGLGDHTDVGPEFPWDVFMQMVGAPNREAHGMSYTVRSGAGDGSIYLVPGGLAPSGLIACFAIYGTEYNALPQVQLPNGMSVSGTGMYDVKPKPWPAGGISGGGGLTEAQLAAAVRAELDRTGLGSVPGRFTAV